MINRFFAFAAMISFLICFSCKDPISNTESPFNDIPVKEAKILIKEHPELVLLDARTPGEIAEGKIAGALEIDFKNVNHKAELAKLDKQKEYLVYCRSGRRSGLMMDEMKAQGFDNVNNLDGGFIAWQKDKK